VVDPNRGGAQVDSFLEGPSFDREGNLWCVDIPFGRVFRVDPKGEWSSPCSTTAGRTASRSQERLDLHRRLQARLMLLDPKSGKIETYLATAFSEGFKA